MKRLPGAPGARVPFGIMKPLRFGELNAASSARPPGSVSAKMPAPVRITVVVVLGGSPGDADPRFPDHRLSVGIRRMLARNDEFVVGCGSRVRVGRTDESRRQTREAVGVASWIRVVLQPQIQGNGQPVAQLPIVCDVTAEDVESDTLFSRRREALKERTARAASIEEVGQFVVSAP